MILKRKIGRDGVGKRATCISSNEGVSIIEALIASVILVIALVGFLKVAMSTTNLGGRNTKMASAISLINDKYEELILADYDNVVDGSEPSIDIDSQGNIIQGLFNRAITTSQLPDGTAMTVAKNVTITITWPGHTVSQTSIFMRR